MEEFSKRLKELRLEKGLTLEQLAKELNVSDVAVGRWERKQRVPNLEIVIAIAKFFNVTTDYLLGLSDF